MLPNLCVQMESIVSNTARAAEELEKLHLLQWMNEQIITFTQSSYSQVEATSFSHVTSFFCLNITES